MKSKSLGLKIIYCRTYIFSRKRLEERRYFPIFFFYIVNIYQKFFIIKCDQILKWNWKMHTHTFTTSDKSVTKLNSSTSKVEKKKFLIEFSILPAIAPFFLVHSRDVQHFLKVCYLLGILRKVFEFYRKERIKKY